MSTNHHHPPPPEGICIIEDGAQDRKVTANIHPILLKGRIPCIAIYLSLRVQVYRSQQIIIHFVYQRLLRPPRPNEQAKVISSANLETADLPLNIIMRRDTRNKENVWQAITLTLLLLVIFNFWLETRVQFFLLCK